jgi:hypothetical protein
MCPLVTESPSRWRNAGHLSLVFAKSCPATYGVDELAVHIHNGVLQSWNDDAAACGFQIRDNLGRRYTLETRPSRAAGVSVVIVSGTRGSEYIISTGPPLRCACVELAYL